MGRLDEAFIQAPEHRPIHHLTNSGEFIFSDEIPTIDLSSLQDPNSDKTSIATEVGKACERWGIFQVINHGLPLDLRRRVENTAAEFFNLTAEEKRRLKRDEVNPNNYGENTWHASHGLLEHMVR
ncbi:PREDICTED: flavanone 3-dioxygenase [Brassica oleracea var. oleracea]|uniref:Non-haem dioxygenase N-terminal domain-containing protein n=1 Tax=Brassica oleracea var. oleracea TaxID=109376 RepID=A0A0D3CIM7_BRAOL|nr:PREDICTED: flavanone 3-dioxygenase [Brassica oleracea var. oleracea]